MFENRISGFEMGLGEQQDSSANQPLPFPAALVPGMLASNLPSVQIGLGQVSLGDIYQAAKNRAIQDHELDKLFNAEFYDDYQI